MFITRQLCALVVKLAEAITSARFHNANVIICRKAHRACVEHGKRKLFTNEVAFETHLAELEVLWGRVENAQRMRAMALFRARQAHTKIKELTQNSSTSTE